MNYHHCNMKADIPDSITISRDKEGVLHHSYWTTDQQLVPFDETTFINKDALLEWIEGKMTIEEETEGYIGGYDAALKEVIDKINSL